MKLALLILFLTQSMHTYGFSLYLPEDCMDFTVGDCVIADDSIISQFPTGDAPMCQEVCRQLSSCILFSHDGHTCSLLSKEYRKGCGNVGAPVDVDVDHCQEAIVESCSGFDEENCEYLGESIGIDPPNGEVSGPLVCQNLCETFGFMGCTFWVYKDKEQSCQLLKSNARRCTGISGPRAPPIEDCGFWASTTTHQPTSTTQNPSCSFGSEFMGSCYELVEMALSWDDSSKDCSNRGGALASIPNEDVNTFLTTLTTSSSWIGGSDVAEEGVWVWPNGDQLTYTNWDRDQPSNCCGGEDCMEFRFHGTASWNDRDCTYGQQYICEFPFIVVE